MDCKLDVPREIPQNSDHSGPFCGFFCRFLPNLCSQYFCFLLLITLYPLSTSAQVLAIHLVIVVQPCLPKAFHGERGQQVAIAELATSFGCVLSTQVIVSLYWNHYFIL